ncbi:eukaryotic translation initiation factor 4G, putative, partial [Rhizoctonia solani AG-3 Rhs1AP]
MSHNETHPGIHSKKQVQMGITTDKDDRLVGPISITAAAPKGGGLPPATTPTPIFSVAAGQCSTEVERHMPNSRDFLFLSNYSHPSPLSISSSVGMRPKRLVPVNGPLNLTDAWKSHGAAPLPALASARIIEDLNAVPYPRTVRPPNPDLNFMVAPGKFRYNREFLLQFMGVCKERPDSLLALDMIGLEPDAGYPNAGRSDRRCIGSLGIDNAPPLQHQASIGLGLASAPANRSGFAMGDFQSLSNSRFGVNNTTRVEIPVRRGADARLKYPNRNSSQGGNYPGKPGGGNLASEAYATRSPTRANDHLEFGKIQKPTGIHFGPSSVFSRKIFKMGRGGGTNMFSTLNTGNVASVSLPAERATNSRKPIVNPGPSRPPVIVGEGKRKNLVSRPRTKLTEVEANTSEGEEDLKKEKATLIVITEKEMKNEIKEDVKVSLPSDLDKVNTGEMTDQISVYGKPGVPPRELLIKAFDQVHHK